jgi:hypothetical protein
MHGLNSLREKRGYYPCYTIYPEVKSRIALPLGNSRVSLDRSKHTQTLPILTYPLSLFIQQTPTHLHPFIEHAPTIIKTTQLCARYNTSTSTRFNFIRPVIPPTTSSTITRWIRLLSRFIRYSRSTRNASIVQ